MKPNASQSGQGMVVAPSQVGHEGEAGVGEGGAGGGVGVEEAVTQNLGGRR